MITFAASTQEALEALQDAKELGQPFHLILSDISRDYTAPAPAPAAASTGRHPAPHVVKNPTGIDMLKEFETAGVRLPVIFYAGYVDAKAHLPNGAFGITDRPDQLLQLVLDALARTRG